MGRRQGAAMVGSVHDRKRFLSISKKFSIGAIVIIFLVVTVVLTTAGIFFKRSSLANFYESSAVELSEFSDSISMFFKAKEASLNVFAESDEIRATDSSVHSFADESGTVQILAYPKSRVEEEIRKICKSFAKSDSDITEIYIGTKWGGLATNSDGSMEGGYDPRKRGWYETASKGNGKVVITKAFASTNGAVVVCLAKCAYNKAGEFVGVAALEMSLDVLTQILENMHLGKGSFLMMVQSDGTILADTSVYKSNFKKVSELGIGGLPDLVSSKNAEGKIRIGGETYFTQHVANERTGYQIMAFCPKSTVFAPYYHTLMVSIVISVVFTVLIAVFTAFATKKTLRPLNTMVSFVTKFVSSLENGSDDYTPRVRVSSHDEVGKLAASINHFIEKLGVVMGQIRESQRKEREMGRQLFESAQNLVVSTKETAATSQDSSAAVKEIVATMEDSNILSENISSKIKNVSGVANKTSSDVADGVSKIEENVNRLHEIFDANQQTISGIKNLTEKIENIWDIVTLINNVADQAKIIAFNAELEASSAGEAGKSFRIVANEIRRLSDGIIDGTKEIKEKINEIQHSADALLLTSKSGTEKINAGYENAQGLEEKFASIRQSSEVTASSADEIADIIQQQASASEQILIALKEISNGVENFTVATDNISSAAENVRRISRDLNNANEDN